MSKLETNTIDNISGSTTLTIGDTNTSTIQLKSGATLTNFPNNTPIFYGELAADQSVTRNANNKITGMTSNEIDTDTAFDGTTFTVPSGKGGKYIITGVVNGYYVDAGSDGERTSAFIYKNGSQLQEGLIYKNSSSANYADIREVTVVVSCINTLSVGDTIELYAQINDFSGNGSKARAGKTLLSGYKLVE